MGNGVPGAAHSFRWAELAHSMYMHPSAGATFIVVSYGFGSCARFLYDRLMHKAFFISQNLAMRLFLSFA